MPKILLQKFDTTVQIRIRSTSILFPQPNKRLRLMFTPADFDRPADELPVPPAAAWVWVFNSACVLAAMRHGVYSFLACNALPQGHLYLKSGGSLEYAQDIADHAFQRTTKLYDRAGDQLSLDEIERIPSL